MEAISAGLVVGAVAKLMMAAETAVVKSVATLADLREPAVHWKAAAPST